MISGTKKLSGIPVVEDSSRALTIAEETSQMMISDDDFRDAQSDQSEKHTATNTYDTGSSTVKSGRSVCNAAGPSMTQNPVYKMLLYLMQCYERTVSQERNFPKVIQVNPR